MHKLIFMSTSELNSPLKLYVVGVNYKKADTATRGMFSISSTSQKELIKHAVSKGMDGLLLVSTCNRTEIIGFAEHPFKLIELLSNHWQNGTIKEFGSIAYVYKSSEAVNHLFRLVSGLDSQILGDYEIVGQLKTAFQMSKSFGGINTYLDKLFSHLMKASKRVKNETDLSSGTTSVSYASVQFLLQEYGSLDDKTVLLYGLGEIGKNTYKHLLEYALPQKIIVVNRSREKLENLMAAKPQHIEITGIDNLDGQISFADIMIVATGSNHPTVEGRNIPADKELLILDLSVPSNVANEVKALKNIRVIDLDHLSKITNATLNHRRQEIPKAEEIIAVVESEFYEWLDIRKFSPAINALKESLETIRKNEINIHMRKHEHFTSGDLDKITSRLMQKVVRKFAKHIRANTLDANQTLDLMCRIFEIEKITIK